MLEYFGFYLLLGAAAGLLAGLFGIGGGIILVPFLNWIFTIQGMPADQVMLMAIATSLATIMITSIASVRMHNKLGAVKWDIALQLVPGIVLGSLLGTLIAQQLNTEFLKTIFGLFLIVVAVQMGFQLRPKTQTMVLGKWTGRVGGVVIGACSSLLGIGGGTLTVPFLVKCRQPIRNAVAISAVCGFPIAVAGTIGYIVLGWNAAQPIAGSIGYIFAPAFLGIVTGSVFSATWGAKLAHRLPTEQLKRLFAVFILAVALKLLV